MTPPPLRALRSVRLCSGKQRRPDLIGIVIACRTRKDRNDTTFRRVVHWLTGPLSQLIDDVARLRTAEGEILEIAIERGEVLPDGQPADLSVQRAAEVFLLVAKRPMTLEALPSTFCASSPRLVAAAPIGPALM